MSIFKLKHWVNPVIGVSLLAFILPSNVALGDMTVYESFATKNASRIELIGEGAGEQLGAAITTGDFNGDGIDDLAIGSPFSSVNRKEFNGKVSIFFGRKNIEFKKNVLTTFVPDVVFYGESSGDQLGTSLTAGDFNNDGIEDLAMGAYNAYYRLKRAGKVYVVNGQLTWDRQSYDFLKTKPSATFAGVDNGGGFGLTLSTVDISNDNVDDLVIGSPFSSSKEFTRSGIVYAFFGGDTFMSTGVYSGDKADSTIYGNDFNERFGSSIASGHIFGKNTDLVIGAYTADDNDKNETGKIYLYRGEKKFPEKSYSPYSTMVGVEEGEWFGFAVNVKDLNNDGEDDVLVSSFPYNGNRETGKVSAFYNKSDFFKKDSVVYAEEKLADVVIKEPRGQALIGANILTDDFNGNKINEIIVGAPGIGDLESDNAGDVYMVFDEGINKNVIYSADGESVTSTIHGENPDDWFGFAVGILDFNGDGSKDLAIGSRYSDNKQASDNGKVFILMGDGAPYGVSKTVVDLDDRKINRGEVIHEVIEKLDLKTKKADLIESCYQYKEFCLFNFMAISLYNDIKLDPEPILYPDVPVTHKYYEDIVIGTMLGLVNGMTTEKDTPFHPERSISRINALKIILGAADLVRSKYRFELIKELGSSEKLINQPSSFEDIDPKIFAMWWYPRYANFAVEHGIIEKTNLFRPNDKITIKEFNSMLDKTLEYLNSQSQDEEAQS